MLTSSLKSLALAALLAGTAGAAFAQDIMLRATARDGPSSSARLRCQRL